jgi:DNA-binding Xre family transcriptional regulator
MITSHIEEVAKAKGILNAHQLALAMGVSDNLAARVWSGDFERIDKATLNKLCRVLKCQPGKLLKYQPDEDEK